MWLTRRGGGVVLVATAAAVVGSQFGRPALGTVTVGLFAAVIGSGLQVIRVGPPTIERSGAPSGFPGEYNTVSLTVTGSGIARLDDGRPEGITGESTASASLPATVSFEVTYEQRGEHRLGPVSVSLTDALGLVVTRTTVDATDDVLVYPPVYRLGDSEAVFGSAEAESARTFDRLREYAPGDSVRDIHWASSAKRDELVVAEFDARTNERTLLVATEAAEGHADAMAAAGATVAVAALERGFAVELATPGESVTRGSGAGHRHRVLEALARTPSGTSDREAVADVLVRATDNGVTVTAGGRERPFEAVTTSDTTVAGWHS